MRCKLYICDRCGHEFRKHGDIHSVQIPNKVEVPGDVYEPTEVDLCWDCIEELRGWVKGKGNGGEA